MAQENIGMAHRVEVLLQKMAEDYASWRIGCRKPSNESEYDGHVAAFRAKLSIKVGRKYIKVIKDGACNGFIVNVELEDAIFKYGDLLMAASWASPAKNFSRGNVFNDLSRVRWTGIG